MQASLIKKLQKVEHGISHIMGYTTPNKPGKIRVVFDCNAELKGTSLNKKLVSGSDLANQMLVLSQDSVKNQLMSWVILNLCSNRFWYQKG